MLADNSLLIAQVGGGGCSPPPPSPAGTRLSMSRSVSWVTRAEPGQTRERIVEDREVDTERLARAQMDSVARRIKTDEV